MPYIKKRNTSLLSSSTSFSIVRVEKKQSLRSTTAVKTTVSLVALSIIVAAVAEFVLDTHPAVIPTIWTIIAAILSLVCFVATQVVDDVIFDTKEFGNYHGIVDEERFIDNMVASFWREVS